MDGDSFALIILYKLVQRFKSVSFLSGGFVCFQAKFSHLCEASPVRSAPLLLAGGTFPSLSSFGANYSASSSQASSTSNSLSTTPIEQLFGAISSAPPIGYYLECDEQARRNQPNVAECKSNNNNNNNNNTSNLMQTHNENYTQPDPTQDLVIREPTNILDFLYLGSQEDALSKLTMNVSPL